MTATDVQDVRSIRCAMCGRFYLALQFFALPAPAGPTDRMDAGNGLDLLLRNCRCGTTLSVEVIKNVRTISLKEWQLFACLIERSRLDAIEALIQEVGMTDIQAEDFRRYYGLDKRGPDPVRKMT